MQTRKPAQELRIAVALLSDEEIAALCSLALMSMNIYAKMKDKPADHLKFMDTLK